MWEAARAPARPIHTRAWNGPREGLSSPLWAGPSSTRRTRRTGEPELVPGDNLPTVVVPVPLDAYLHVIMANLRAHHLRLDHLLIYLYETRSLQHQQAADHQETHHQRGDQYSVCHALHYPSIHRSAWKWNSQKFGLRLRS